MSSDTTRTSSWHGTFHPSIRRATKTDIPALGRLLARSFYDDPLLKLIYPKCDQRLQSAEKHFVRMLNAQIRGGDVTTIECKSVALWAPPNPPRQTLWERYLESIYMRKVFGRRVHLVRQYYQRMAARHPSTPHWYLMALATDEPFRGQGFAGLLLEQMSRYSDELGQNVALETTNESHLTFYEKFGFRTRTELLLDEGVNIWLMFREHNGS